MKGCLFDRRGNSAAPPGQILFDSTFPTGCALLHPWLQSLAPLGPGRDPCYNRNRTGEHSRSSKGNQHRPDVGIGNG